jgi:dTDP-glucose 4,6-dehydratase
MTQRLVLASNSFAGAAYVAHALRLGHEVVGVSRSPEPGPLFLPYRHLAPNQQARFRFVQADLNSDLERIFALLDETRPEVVVDFAGQGMVAESWGAPEQWYQTNVVAKSRLHGFLRHKDWLKRYVRISTPEVYGSCEGLIAETAPYRPSTPYAVSHAATDMSLRAFHQALGFPVVIGRFANFFGEHQQLYRIVPKTILCVLTGQRLPLHGGGTSVRAFIHTSDVATGIEAMIARGALGEVYHFSTDRFVSIRQVVETICAKLGVAFDTAVEVSPERLGKDQAYLMDTAKARAALGWHDRVSFGEGLDHTIAWIKANLADLRALPWTYQHKP